jgi:long-chain fatty acid transport protein
VKLFELTRASLLASAVVMCTWGSRADASAFQLIEQNASGLGNAYAGQAATAEDASTIFFNPAGLTRLPRLQLVAGGSVIALSAKFEDGGSTAAPLQPLGGVNGDPGDAAFVPHAYLSYEAVPGMIWTGVGLGVPFGLKTDWDADWMGRFHSVKSEVKTININPTVAWKIAPWASVGAGVNYQWVEATLTNSVNYSAIAFGTGGAAALGALVASGCGTAAGGCEGIADVTADTWSWGWNIGAMFEAPTQTRVGLSYRSSMKHRAKGDVEFSNRPTLLAAGLPDGPVRATVELPDTASIAVVQQVVPRLELLADFTWTGWSSLKDLSIFRTDTPGIPEGLTSTPLEFRDSWRLGLGGNYQATDALKVRLGVAYDRSPVKDEFRTPRLPDDHRTWVAGGVQWAFLPQAALDVGFAYLFLSDMPSNLPNVDPDPPAGFTPTPKGALVGEYTDPSVFIAAAQLRYSF